jgi:hypothetical protein
MNVTTIGLDLAKSVFQVHGIDAHGKMLITRQLRRGKVLEFFANLPACLVVAQAAMLMRRGVSLVLIPSTLLAQIDAAVGGKNGINYPTTTTMMAKPTIASPISPTRRTCNASWKTRSCPGIGAGAASWRTAT